MSRLAVVAAGGTGGHMFPAEALARVLTERGWRIARRALMNHRHVDGAAARLLPNLLAEVALYQLESPRG